MQSTLVKAQLKPHDGGETFKFMFNPKELSFETIIETADNSGARSDASGKPMVSFSNIKARKISISDILFDTFETGENVRGKIKNLIAASEFLPRGEQRPPLFLFSWGAEIYFDYCLVEKVDYKLTKFLADGTPVRAIVSSLVLKETDGDATGNASNPKPMATPETDTLQSRLQP